MNQYTLLHRQVHPNFVRHDEATSQAFIPTRKDNNRLSVYDGDMIAAAQTWEHYTLVLGLRSIGVVSVTVGECQTLKLPVRPDPSDFPEHVLIGFDGLTNSQSKTFAKLLRQCANTRGWLFRP